jgi:hypothetical protein
LTILRAAIASIDDSSGVVEPARLYLLAPDNAIS